MASLERKIAIGHDCALTFEANVGTLREAEDVFAFEFRV
jgi:hypothetical protein